MDNPGKLVFTYGGEGGSFPLTPAGVYVGDWIEDLNGMLSASLEANFQYGAGGTNVDVYIQTTLDDGNSAIDIAHVQFGTANGTEVMNLSALTPVGLYVPLSQALAANSVKDGLLGTKLRAVVVVTGTYTGQNQLHLTGVVR
jgi:hypothetical protein